MAEYDLDVTFDEDDVAPDLSKVAQDDLVAAITQLPKNQADVAQLVLVEKRTLSDVSQRLAIRQPELVRLLHRAKVQIGLILGVTA
jgi:DNA-directed RNA polymerase specialized sigma24 family protein